MPNNNLPLYGAIEGGGTKFICAIGNGPGNIRAEVRIETTTPEETMKQVADFFKQQETNFGKLAAIGFACFGPLDPSPGSPTFGHILPTPKPGWSNADVVGMLKESFDVPIAFDTDVNGAAFGEWRWGKAQGLRTFIYLTVGTGVGGGAYVEGNLLHGLLHPEMGHIPLKHDLKKDSFEGVCPFHGDCFEGLASGVAVEKRWGLRGAQLAPEHIAWDFEADYIAQALTSYTMTLSPERIIIGGGVGSLPHLLTKVQKRTRELINGYIQSPVILKNIETYIVNPGLGGRSGVLGALALAEQAPAESIMIEPSQLETEVRRSLSRILPRVEETLKRAITKDLAAWEAFTVRLQKSFPLLLSLYADVYSGRYDFFYHLEDLVVTMARSWFERPQDLRELDDVREQNPHWFQSNQMLGGVLYVDLFAENLDGVRKKIPYFKELGLTYIHLMPLFKAPEGENDGGYAVSSYREVNPPLGTMKQLSSLAREFRKAGISLVVDLVFNHTSDEHLWAERAKQGDEDFMDFYRLFPDRELPSLYEQNLREIFPEEHAGAFSPVTINEKEYWVWTTFHAYQWDLNYANPAVFNRMAEEMLFLANQGVEVLRFDAVAFIWKQLGTSCENLPQAHTLIKAFNAVARIAAPALVFKSEAIVHPDDVVKYVSQEECQVSYNPLLMALLWNSLATRETRLLAQALAARFRLPDGSAWVNYVRVHDDIGWTFSDEDAAQLGINGYDHRRFLNEFYRGRFPGSFARGLPFQENPITGDCRISGTCASLAGLEKALHEEGEKEVELAIRRILVIHGIIFTAGGIPLIYLGDEIGTLNDYSYRDDPAHERDSRWVHRPRADWEIYKKRSNLHSLEGHIYQGFRNMIELRKQHDAFSGGELEIIHTENDHVLGFTRLHNGNRAVVFANFSESTQIVEPRVIEQYTVISLKKLHGHNHVSANNSLIIEPLDFVVFG